MVSPFEASPQMVELSRRQELLQVTRDDAAESSGVVGPDQPMLPAPQLTSPFVRLNY
ncbi:MAG: hypothetical protein WAM97_16800 [Acidimicrobiales bacterium]